jgi:hypothetical protein
LSNAPPSTEAAVDRAAHGASSVGARRHVVVLVDGPRHVGRDLDYVHGRAGAAGAEDVRDGVTDVGDEQEGE